MKARSDWRRDAAGATACWRGWRGWRGCGGAAASGRGGVGSGKSWARRTALEVGDAARERLDWDFEGAGEEGEGSPGLRGDVEARRDPRAGRARDVERDRGGMDLIFAQIGSLEYVFRIWGW